MDRVGLWRLVALVLVALVLVALAVFSVQNAAPVALQFLVLRSVPLPVGVVLALAVAVGLTTTALAQTLWPLLAGSADDRAGFEASFEEDDEEF